MFLFLSGGFANTYPYGEIVVGDFANMEPALDGSENLLRLRKVEALPRVRFRPSVSWPLLAFAEVGVVAG